jgi:hypothetical protein
MSLGPVLDVADLLVMKAFAARDKDWADVTSILERLIGKRG